jgi:spermidine synthase
MRRGQKPRQTRRPPITFSEEDGVRYLHFGTEWIQGAMNLKRPYAIELEYAQQMMAPWLFLGEPEHVMQLGLGAASLTKFCYQAFPHARVTSIELDGEVIAAARSMFRLPPNDERLTVIEGDAAAVAGDPQWRKSVDWLQVDLYDATARGPVLNTEGFYSICRSLLKHPGVMSVNLFGDHPSFDRNWHAICRAFDNRALALPEVHEGNRVVLGFRGPPISVSWATLYEAAEHIEQRSRLPAAKWVSAIKSVTPSEHPGLVI